MDLFKLLDSNMSSGDTVTIGITKQGNQLVVTLLHKLGVADGSNEKIPPFNAKGTASELDDQYLDAIKTPIQQTGQWSTEVTDFSKKLESAKKASDVKKKENDKIKTVTDKAKKLLDNKEYDKAIKAIPTELREHDKLKKLYSDIIHGKANSLVEAKEYDKALKAIPESMREQPKLKKLVDQISEAQMPKTGTFF